LRAPRSRRNAEAFIITIAVLAAALYASAACAADFGGVEFTLGAFGTLGVVHSSEEQADFTSSVIKPTGAGFSHAWSNDVDSVVGAQVSADFTKQLSAVVQVISQQESDDSYRPAVQWANIKYQVTDDFTARVGRTVMPFLLYSDSRLVGYTRPWLRLPPQVYSLSPLTRSDGLDISYRIHVGEWTNTAQGLVGTQDINLASAGTAKARDIEVISLTSERGPLTARLVYQQAHVSVASLDPLFDAFRQFGPQGIVIANTYDVSEKHFSAIGAGASYDPGNWMVVAEWTRVTTHSVLGRTSGWYASSGYRLGNFMPYGIFAQGKADNLSASGLSTAELPPFLFGPATGLNGALNSILRTKNVSNTLSVGARWDFFKNLDLKLQYDHTRIGAGSTGALANVQPGFQTGSTFSLTSATLDFVF
jgi:hypothetical protein